VTYHNFPCLKLALEAGRKGGTHPAVLCAADEIATHLFLAGQTGFPGIAEIVAKTVDLHRGIANPTLDEILAADTWGRETAANIATKESLC